MKKKKPDKSKSGNATTKAISKKNPYKIKISGDVKVLLFLLVLVFILYGNTIPNRYALDDEMVTNNSVVKKGLKAIPEIFTTRYVSNEEQNYDYRPVVKFSFALEYAMFKDNPHVGHLINVLLYFLLCFLLYVILKLLLHKYHPWLPLMIVMLFAAHPVHTEVVASLKNRDELLSMLGALATWYLIIRFTDTRKWFLLPLAVFFFLLGYYSKSNIIVYAAVIPLSLYFFREVKLSKVLLILGTLLVTAVILNLLPRMLLSPPHREMLYFENPLIFEKGLWLRIGTGLIVVLFYIRLLIIPHPLLFYYGYDMIPITTPLNIWAIISLIICLALLMVALYLFKRRHIISFSILYFFVTISAFANIIKPPPGIVAERFLLSASLGYVLAVCVLIFLLFRLDIHQKAAYSLKTVKYPLMLFLLMLIPFTLRTIIRNKDWKDYKTLYSHDIVYLEKSAKANAVYASILYTELSTIRNPQRIRSVAAESEKYYKQTLKIYPGYINAWNNLGIIYFSYQRRPAEAIGCWRKAVYYDSTYATPLVNIAMAYEQMSRPDSAENYYLKAIKAKKNYAVAYSKLGDLYFKQGELQKAIAINEKLMETESSSDIPYVNIGNYYMYNADTIKAIDMWEKAIEKQSKNVGLCRNLAGYFARKGNYQKAEYYKELARGNSKRKPR